MPAKAPPVPPANQSPKGTGDAKPDAAADEHAAHGTAPDPAKQGQQGNTAVNTNRQNNQQDR